MTDQLTADRGQHLQDIISSWHHVANPTYNSPLRTLHPNLHLCWVPSHQGPLVRHVSGRSFVSREERIKMGWPAERPSAARRVRHVRQGNQGDAYSPLDGLDTLPLDSDDADQKV